MNRKKYGAVSVFALMILGIVALGLFTNSNTDAIISNDESKLTYNGESYILVDKIPDNTEIIEYFSAKKENESFFDKINNSYECTLYQSDNNTTYITVVKYVDNSPLNSVEPYCYKSE